MMTMGFRQIRHTAVGLGLLLVLPSVAQPDSVWRAGVFSSAAPSNNSPERALERILNQPASDSLRLDGANGDQLKRAPQAQKDTIHRYKNSGRVLILGGPEAFSM
ncbi:MAG: hypothetical protein C5B53_08370 [Candidatus Melainabacteria bacterium]|nr:MAG: hypothetical protein C5B53_08370 [Candidatus Melainabacteria bacterium]